MIILIFGKQQEICEVELHRRDIFPVRRLSGGPVWHEQNASQPPPGTGKQLCHSIAAQSDQTGKRPPDRRRVPSSRARSRSKHTEAVCPNPHCCSPSDRATARGWEVPAFLKHPPEAQHDHTTASVPQPEFDDGFIKAPEFVLNLKLNLASFGKTNIQQHSENAPCWP